MSRAIPRFAAGLAVVFALAGAGLGFIDVGVAGATVPTFTVNSFNDFPSAVPGTATCQSTETGGTCTLRAAISAADFAGGVVIVPDGTYDLTVVPATNDDIQSGDLNVGNNVTIMGDVANPAAVVINGEGNSRIFDINTESPVTISGVTVTNGNPDADGTITGNFNGGGILVRGGPTTISRSIVTANEAPQTNGGGIDVTGGPLTLDSVTVSDNGTVGNATFEGGGIEFEASGASTYTIENSTISGNQAGYSSGGGGGIYQNDSGTLNVTNTTISGNVGVFDGSQGWGGGVNFNDFSATDTFSGDTISNNQAYNGGGVFNDAGGNITFTDSTISGNVVSNNGGGLELDSTDATVSISGSTISGNMATGGSEGGGVYNDVCDTLSLTNDTIAGNTASTDGGGFYGDTSDSGGGSCAAGEPLNFLYDTVTGNTAGTGGGGDIELQAAAALNLSDSIVAGGTPTSCLVGNVSASLVSGGYNLLGDSSCTTNGTDLVGQNPQLGALANNGGATLTELPGSTSPAIGAIPAAVCSTLGVNTDQRGVSRPQGAGGTCTIGAVEVSNFNPNGYRLVANEGGIFDFGLNFNGSLANNHLNAPIVGIANSPGANGYLMAGGDGGVFALGRANFFGSLGGQAIPSPIAAIAATPSEDGYWLVSQTGTISHFGNTPSLPAIQLPHGAHIVGMASTNDGKGAWLTDNFGDVYAEGDAQYVGGLGGVHINAPIVGIAAAATGQGYVLVAADGGAFTYGVGFHGSVPGSLAPGQKLVAPIVGIAVTHSGNGYWMVGADGGVFNYGDAPFLGSIYTAIPGKMLNGPIVGIQHLGSAPV